MKRLGVENAFCGYGDDRGVRKQSISFFSFFFSFRRPSTLGADVIRVSDLEGLVPAKRLITRLVVIMSNGLRPIADWNDKTEKDVALTAIAYMLTSFAPHT